MKLLRYLFHSPIWHNLPMMPRMYSTEYQTSDVDEDTEALMRLTHIRCPQGVRLLEKRYQKDAGTLIRTLPIRKRKRRVKARLRSLMQRIFGLLPYDPMKSIAREQRDRE